MRWPRTLASSAWTIEVAGNARYTAVLDACVLYPIAIADALISLATTGLYAAKWTRIIEEEWVNALENNRPDLRGRVASRRDCMRRAVPDWEVDASASMALVSGLSLPDAGDRHVLAAAVVGHADCIVTANRRDFPASILASFGIELIDPDGFIIRQWDLDAVATMTAFKKMRERRQKPLETAVSFADTLEANGLPLTGQRIREASTLI